MSTSLIKTKLCIPQLRPNIIARPHLKDRLNEGLWQGDGFTRKLTLISAPAGFGKTTLVVDWLRGVEVDVAWLSLDENDNDPIRLLAYLVAALGETNSDIGSATQALLQSPQRPANEALLTSLINEVSAISTPFVLAIDDYHTIQTPSIHEQISFVLKHQPPHMHQVIITREDPPLPLHRLRARGQMLEMRQGDIRFTTEEMVDFLRRVMGLDVSLEDIAALEHRIE